MTDIFIGEMLGTAILILIGNGVVMNISFKNTFGSGGGLWVALFAWGMAVFAGVMVANIWGTGGHLNPAVTLAQLAGGKMNAATGFTYIGAQLLGALIGQIVVNIMYWTHIKEESIKTVLGAHATSTTRQDKVGFAVFSEYVGTVVLVLCAVFAIQGNWFGGAPLAIAFVVMVIGASLGGVTNWAINPARDLMPRTLHFIMYKVLISRGAIPAPAKGETISNWKYAWVPVAGPLAGGIVIGACLYI